MFRSCRTFETVRVTVRVSKVLPKGCPRHRPRDCPTASRRAVRGADEGIHPCGWEVVNPSCGDLHRRSSSTLLPLRYESVTKTDQTLYAVSIVILGWYVGQKFLFSAAFPNSGIKGRAMRRCRLRSRIHRDVWV